MKQAQEMIPVPRHDVVLPPSADGSSFETYKAVSAAMVAITLPEGAQAEDFFIDATNWQLPHAVITRARSCAQNISRGKAEIAKEDAPTLQMYLHVAGEVDAVCGGRRLHFGPGDIVVYDSRLGYEAKAGDFDVRIIMVPRDRAPPLFLSPGIHGLKLSGDTATTRLLAGWIKTLVDTIDDLTVADADLAVTTICQLAASLLETPLAPSDDENPWIEPTLESALAYIMHRINDPDLSMQDVRAHLGISRSGLYRMFEPYGGIDAAIRQRRLDAALRLMLSRGSPRLTLKGMAKRHGYRKNANFVRAFVGRFGITPAEIREKTLARDQDWLEAQANRAGFATLKAWIAALAPKDDL